MTRRDLPLLVMGIFLLQEKGGDAEWWNEKGERGGARQKKTKRTR